MGEMDKKTPNLDSLSESLKQAHSRTLGCHCRKPPRAKTRERTNWLKKFGILSKKKTARGWRRAWQCKLCLRDMGGDGINAGPPTDQLPAFFESDDPYRQAVTAKRLANWEREKSQLPSSTEAWFRDHDLYLKTDRWRKLRGLVLARDRYRCVKCGSAANHVHHKTYERWQKEKLEDLLSLCRSCHEREHADDVHSQKRDRKW